MTLIDIYKIAVLQVLRRGPFYAVELIDYTGIVQGTMYRILPEMETAGLVERFEEQASDRGGRPRQYYYLTEAGTARAEQDKGAIMELFGE